ncbi:MAG: PQQ-binding-like beta-propeller repeat protein [Chitinispirillaceae bacterium]|nr:PQQ-binding-like beta-propeller repeat protein [Chitinispirillaceae bacterium]
MIRFISLSITFCVWSIFTAGAQQPTGGAKLIRTIDFKGAGGCPGLRLGDINGDGKYEIVMGQPLPQTSLDAHTPQEVVRVTAFDLTGTKLWQYTRPGNPSLTGHTASSDIPLQVYDIDGDGAAEVLAAFGRDKITVLNGRNGSIERTIPIPQGTSATGASGSNDCIIIANLRGTEWPQDFIVKTRYTQIWGIDGRDGTVLWTYKKGTGDNLCHFGYAFNADNDKMDEYISGWQLLDHDGKVLWSAKNLTMHIDAVTVGDMDNNPNNGLEVILASQVGVAYRASTGEELWRDNSTTPSGQGIQHIAMGDYDTTSPGREVAMLERIGPRTDQGRDANIFVSSTGKLIWKENRTGDDYGWLSVTERITNWNGDGRDQILSYRRTFTSPTIYNIKGQAVVTFTHPGENIDFVMHADLGGDDKEEVIVYNETTAWIYSNGDCDLSAPPRKPSLPQNRRLYNWTIYSGWEAVDFTFYTPGSTGVLSRDNSAPENFRKPRENRASSVHSGSATAIMWNLQGKVVFKGQWNNGKGKFPPNVRRGIHILSASCGNKPGYNKIVVE